MPNQQYSSSLDTLQLSLHPSSSTSYRAYITQNLQDEIRLVEFATERIKYHSRHNWLARFRDCRTKAWFLRNVKTGLVRVAANHCGFRYCPMCASSKSGYVRHNVKEWLEKKKYPKFITFTVQHSTQELTDQVQHLYESFRKLRRLKEIKKGWHGGVWFFQITKSAKDNLWHPHLHVITYGHFIHQKRLSEMWLAETGDSCIVDIRAVKDPQKAADYCSRYVSRPMNPKSLTVEEFTYLIEQLHNRRLCGCWGKRPHPYLNYHPAADCKDWKEIGSWSLVHTMLGFNDSANAILDSWKSGTPIGEEHTLKDIENFIDNTAVFEGDEIHPPPNPKSAPGQDKINPQLF